MKGLLTENADDTKAYEKRPQKFRFEKVTYRLVYKEEITVSLEFIKLFLCVLCVLCGSSLSP